jgi:hypothetical protein
VASLARKVIKEQRGFVSDYEHSISFFFLLVEMELAALLQTLIERLATTERGGNFKPIN